MSKNSANMQNHIDAFVDAQRDYVTASLSAIDAETARVSAFTGSALAASAARKARVTLQKLADANKAATADLSAPKGTLYTSLAAVTVHAFTGDVLTLPVQEGEDVKPIAPLALQSLILKLYKAKGAGTSVLKDVIGAAKTQQAAQTALREALDTLAELADAVPADDQDGSDSEDSSQDSDNAEPAGQTIETLLSRVMAMITEGAEVSPAARAMIDQLSQAVSQATPIGAVA